MSTTLCIYSQRQRGHCTREVNDYTATRVCEYLRENEKFRQIVYVCSFGVQVEFLTKKGSKILVTLFL